MQFIRINISSATCWLNPVATSLYFGCGSSIASDAGCRAVGLTHWVSYGSMGLSKNRWSNINIPLYFTILHVFQYLYTIYTLYIIIYICRFFICALHSVTRDSRKSWNPNHQTWMILVTFIQDFDWCSQLLLTYLPISCFWHSGLVAWAP